MYMKVEILAKHPLFEPTGATWNPQGLHRSHRDIMEPKGEMTT